MANHLFSLISSLQRLITAIDLHLPQNNPNDIFTNALNFVYFAIGVTSVGVLIYAGITYIMSSGNAEKLTKAKNTITYSIIGIIFAIAAFAITRFVSGIFSS